MEVEVEAGCAEGIQLVKAEGEQGVGGDVKGNSVHLEEDSILDLDEGELSNELDQVIASSHIS